MADWVPSSTLHRPDGFSMYFEDENPVIIAFEVELTHKTRSRYESVVAYYDSEPSIQYVLWLVESKSVMNSIKHGFQKYQMRDWHKHNFILLSDFKRKGWMAPFIDGNLAGKIIKDLIPHSPCTNPVLPMHSSAISAFQSIRKRTILPSTSEKTKNLSGLTE